MKSMAHKKGSQSLGNLVLLYLVAILAVVGAVALGIPAGHEIKGLMSANRLDFWSMISAMQPALALLVLLFGTAMYLLLLRRRSATTLAAFAVAAAISGGAIFVITIIVFSVK